MPSLKKKAILKAYNDASPLPFRDIGEPTNLDVLCGRGVATNRHIGNENFRALVKCNKERYVCCTKSDKMKMSRSIVQSIRVQNGRFLEKDNSYPYRWVDIGDRKAIEKTSQALRDGAAPLRKRLAEEEKERQLKVNAAAVKDNGCIVENPRKDNSSAKSEIEYLQDAVTNGKNKTNVAVENPGKGGASAKSKKKTLQGRVAYGKNDAWTGLNSANKDSEDKRKCCKPKTVLNLDLEKPLLFTRVVSTDSSPRITQEPLLASNTVMPRHPVNSTSMPSQCTHVNTAVPTTVSPVPNNLRCLSPIPLPQHFTAAVPTAISPTPKNNTRPNESYSSPHLHLPDVMERDDWELSQQSNAPYNSSRHYRIPPQESIYHYGVPSSRTSPPTHPNIIPSSSNQQTPAAQHHENHVSSAIDPEPHNTGSRHSFSSSPTAYQQMRMKQTPSGKRGHVQNIQSNFQTINSSNFNLRSHAFYNGRRENQKNDAIWNRVEPSFADTLQMDYDDRVAPPLNDMAPLPYRSGGEYKSEDAHESLNWDVPDVYDLRNQFLMNLIQSPLLE